jgi:hypothetical protein
VPQRGRRKELAHIPPGLRKVLPKGGVVLSFPPSSFDNYYQNRPKMVPESITNGTNLAQGEGKGYPKINKNMKSKKTNVNAKNQHEKKHLL